MSKDQTCRRARQRFAEVGCRKTIRSGAHNCYSLAIGSDGCCSLAVNRGYAASARLLLLVATISGAIHAQDATKHPIWGELGQFPMKHPVVPFEQVKVGQTPA